jgi:hypothetical protein
MEQSAAQQDEKRHPLFGIKLEGGFFIFVETGY